MPSDVSLAEVYRAIGSLTASVDNLRQDAQEADRKAEQHRNRVYSRLEDQASKTARVERDIQDLTTTVSSLKPLAAKAEKWEQRGVGAAMVFATIGSLFGGAFVAFKAKIFAALGLGG